MNRLHTAHTVTPTLAPIFHLLPAHQPPNPLCGTHLHPFQAALNLVVALA